MVSIIIISDFEPWRENIFRQWCRLKTDAELARLVSVSYKDKHDMMYDKYIDIYRSKLTEGVQLMKIYSIECSTKVYDILWTWKYLYPIDIEPILYNKYEWTIYAILHIQDKDSVRVKLNMQYLYLGDDSPNFISYISYDSSHSRIFKKIYNIESLAIEVKKILNN